MIILTTSNMPTSGPTISEIFGALKCPENPMILIKSANSLMSHYHDGLLIDLHLLLISEYPQNTEGQGFHLTFARKDKNLRT